MTALVVYDKTSFLIIVAGTFASLCVGAWIDRRDKRRRTGTLDLKKLNTALQQATAAMERLARAFNPSPGTVQNPSDPSPRPRRTP